MLEGAIKSGYRFALVHSMLDEIPTTIKVKKAFDTACWSFNLKTNHHLIYVGDQITKRVKKGEENIVYYVQSYLFHELSHSLYTHKNLKEVSQWCNENKVPFSLLNLFEDARIEDKWREVTKRNFKWLECEELEEVTKDTNHTAIFFALVQSEATYSTTASPIGATVEAFYKRALAAPTTQDLYPILLEWMETFPDTKEENQDNQNLGGEGEESGGSEQSQISPTQLQDLRVSLMLQESEEIAEHMESGSTTVVSTVITSNNDKDVEINEELAQDKEIEEYSTKDDSVLFMEGYNGVILKKEALAYIPKIEKLFEDKKKKINSASPSKRLNIRGIARGKIDKLYRKETIHKAGQKTANIIVDCSGSMSGGPIRNARTLVFILNELAKKKRLQGHLILSGASGRQGQTKTFRLPVKEETIEAIIADGSSENLKGTIDITKKILKNADWNFVFTDGNICDEAIDKKRLHLQGIYTYGMYAGTNHTNLEDWFDKHIARETLKELIDELVRKIK